MHLDSYHAETIKPVARIAFGANEILKNHERTTRAARSTRVESIVFWLAGVSNTRNASEVHVVSARNVLEAVMQVSPSKLEQTLARASFIAVAVFHARGEHEIAGFRRQFIMHTHVGSMKGEIVPRV